MWKKGGGGTYLLFCLQGDEEDSVSSYCINNNKKAAILCIQYNQTSNWVWRKLTYTWCFCTVYQSIITSSIYCFLCQIDPKQNLKSINAFKVTCCHSITNSSCFCLLWCNPTAENYLLTHRHKKHQVIICCLFSSFISRSLSLLLPLTLYFSFKSSSLSLLLGVWWGSNTWVLTISHYINWGHQFNTRWGTQ